MGTRSGADQGRAAAVPGEYLCRVGGVGASLSIPLNVDPGVELAKKKE